MKRSARLYLIASAMMLGAVAFAACSSSGDAQPNAPRAVLTGRVVDELGQPAVRCLILPGGNYTNEMATYSGGDGTFVVTLPDGRYDVRAECRDYDGQLLNIGVASVAISSDAPIQVTITVR